MRAQPITALGVGLLMCSVLPVSGCGPTNGNAGSHNDYTITDRVTSLAIDNPVGNTRIEGTDATTVSVTEQLRYTGNPPQTRHEITDGQLTLSYTCPAEVNNVDGDACSVTYLVRCPTTRCTNQWPGRYSNVDRARRPPDLGLQGTLKGLGLSSCAAPRLVDLFLSSSAAFGQRRLRRRGPGSAR
jgi:hypothetical protein